MERLTGNAREENWFEPSRQSLLVTCSCFFFCCEPKVFLEETPGYRVIYH